MNRKKKLAVLIPLGVVGFALFVAIGGEVVKLLWNWLGPALFRLPAVTFWQALGLLVLCRILFGGLGGGGGARRISRRRMAERWARMTPEEREWIAQRLRERWGHVPPPPSGPDTPHP